MNQIQNRFNGNNISSYLFGVLLCFIFNNSFSQNTQPRIKKYSLEEGLSQVTINNLLKDSFGFVWIATEDGLNRFDGNEFRHYKYSESDTTSISGNVLNKLSEDIKGNIWIGTIGNGLNYYDRNKDSFSRIKLENAYDTETVSDILTEDDGTIWITTRASGLHRLQPKEDGSYLQKNYLPYQRLGAISKDAQGQLWIGGFEGEVYKLNPSDGNSALAEMEMKVKGYLQAFYHTEKYLMIGSDFGLFLYNLNGKEVRLFELEKKDNHPTRHVVTFLKEDDSKVWVGTGNGLYLLDLEKMEVLQKVAYEENGMSGLSTNTVYSLIRTAPKQIMVGTTRNLNILDFSEPYFKNISKNKKGLHLLNDNVVFSVLKDGSDLWLGTSDGGLNLIRNGKTYSFMEDINDLESISGSAVLEIVKDYQNNRLWLATTRGLSMINLSNFDPKNPKFTVFHHDSNNLNTISMDYVTSLALDKNGYVWGGTYGNGIFRLEISDKNKIIIVRYKRELNTPNSLGNNFISCIRVDDKNQFWIGTDEGLTELKFTSNQYGRPNFITYQKNDKLENSLSHNSIIDILIDAEKRIWVGTRNGLNLFLGKNDFKSWTKEKQFPNTAVFSIQDDQLGILWLGTNNGIVRFNPENEIFTQYGVEDGIQSKEFNITTRFRDPDGKIYLGGIDGITYFNPEDLVNIDQPQPLYFSELRIKDKIINTQNTSNNILEKSLMETNTLEFKNDQFPFYLQFSSLDYRINKNVEYRYKLLPNDTEWNILKDPEIQFLNLPSGNYTLQVNGFSRDKEWSQLPLEMNIAILPPWWATWWAYAIYAGIIILFTDRFYRFQLSKKIAVSESNRLKEVNEFKNHLFTNITHEFRTPLTVIKGMTDTIILNLKAKKLDDVENSLEMIERNSDGLLHLVNEMLDLAKLESGNMELNLVQRDIIPFVKYLTQSFHSLAKEKEISFSVHCDIVHLEMDLDVSKFTAIITNLISNAIKFTPQNGNVLVNIDKIAVNNTDFIEINVKDNGLGISKEEIIHIFDKFYQVDNSSSKLQKGTGIGLALAKDFVELMHGSIQVESTLGKGSTLSIKIPITNKAVQSDHSELLFSSLNFKTDKTPVILDESQFSNESNKNSPLVLIVEDNIDVAHYIKTCLIEKYQILHAPNGAIGIDVALEKIPDIIISDVMMPIKDGFEVCKTLKGNELTDHIPIIMLTAKATFEDRLTGLSRGADAYLTKPFEKAELLTRIDQLTLLRKKMLIKFEKTGIEKLLNKNVKNSETKFLNKIITVIHENLTHAEFGPLQLAIELHLSESQLYRKLKATSGKSTALFIRSIRLQKAKELILTTNKTISEVAYDVGFNDPSYFSRAFKEEFGSAPSTLSI